MLRCLDDAVWNVLVLLKIKASLKKISKKCSTIEIAYNDVFEIWNKQKKYIFMLVTKW